MGVDADFELITQAMVERIIAAGVLADHLNGVWIGVTVLALVLKEAFVVSMGEILGRMDHTSFARGTDERRIRASQSLIALVEFNAGIDHLLLAECRELVCAEGIVDIAPQFGDQGGVDEGFESGRIASTMTREDVDKGDLTLAW